MKAEIEMLNRPAGVARLFDREGQTAENRDPYCNSMVIFWCGEREVEIKGLVKPMDREQWRALGNRLRRMGIETVWMERRQTLIPLEWDATSRRYRRSNT